VRSGEGVRSAVRVIGSVRDSRAPGTALAQISWEVEEFVCVGVVWVFDL